jgi:hypothetical protein
MTCVPHCDSSEGSPHVHAHEISRALLLTSGAATGRRLQLLPQLASAPAGSHRLLQQQLQLASRTAPHVHVSESRRPPEQQVVTFTGACSVKLYILTNNKPVGTASRVRPQSSNLVWSCVPHCTPAVAFLPEQSMAACSADCQAAYTTRAIHSIAQCRDIVPRRQRKQS